MDVQAYLRRIGIEGESSPNLDFLTRLQQRHMFTVPFENLDVMNKTEITLDPDSMFAKIVHNRRGGFCYELNGLFYRLLQELGYEAELLSGRVAADDHTYGPEFDHMLILVRLDQDYVVDVGFGDSVRSPLPMSGEEVSDVSGTYRIRKNPDESDGFFFQKFLGNQWVSEFAFTNLPRRLSDFHEMCKYQQQSPKSHFTKKAIVSLAAEDGRITLSGEKLIITEKGRKNEALLTSPDEIKHVLKDCFGIIISI
ncbi:arylamine N-acetyltransferase family protein [Paenibacillus sp. USDA918EY]|uniref:arylamine N-acetyltransferase family protein n=1 Tax=Paenibacillus sp. USDA918EY TaxID=2689575 RepID=UPI001357BA2B|nr:arylamine N-acetyltransferase [Paenibacillus sp. USDA918EY]